MRNVVFALAATTAFVLNVPILSSATPITPAAVRDMHARTASDVEKVDYYFWGYYSPLYPYGPHPAPHIVAPYPPVAVAPYPPVGVAPYPPEAVAPYPPEVVAPYPLEGYGRLPDWSNGAYWPQFGWYLDYYQTYGCLSVTQYCIYGELPY